MLASCNIGFHSSLHFLGISSLVQTPSPGPSMAFLEDQLCMFDFSDCQRVAPGGNCTIRCGSDYAGKSTVAYCPSDNTDPNGQLVYLEPKCSLKPCEMRPPPGYVETPCGWECDSGYIGDVNWYCAAVGREPGRCRSELVISGCTLTVQCAPLTVNDTCRRGQEELEELTRACCHGITWAKLVEQSE